MRRLLLMLFPGLLVVSLACGGPPSPTGAAAPSAGGFGGGSLFPGTQVDGGASATDPADAGSPGDPGGGAQPLDGGLLPEPREEGEPTVKAAREVIDLAQLSALLHADFDGAALELMQVATEAAGAQTLVIAGTLSIQPDGSVVYGATPSDRLHVLGADGEWLDLFVKEAHFRWASPREILKSPHRLVYRAESADVKVDLESERSALAASQSVRGETLGQAPCAFEGFESSAFEGAQLRRADRRARITCGVAWTDAREVLDARLDSTGNVASAQRLMEHRWFDGRESYTVDARFDRRFADQRLETSSIRGEVKRGGALIGTFTKETARGAAGDVENVYVEVDGQRELVESTPMR